MKVISRTSMLAYRDTDKGVRTVATELDVASVLEGSVQRAGDTVRIHAKLVDADTEDQLWAEVYDRSLTTIDLFAVQAEISSSIAAALHANLSSSVRNRIARVPTQDLEALEAYFEGKRLLESANGAIASRSCAAVRARNRPGRELCARVCGIGGGVVGVAELQPRCRS